MLQRHKEIFEAWWEKAGVTSSGPDSETIKTVSLLTYLAHVPSWMGIDSAPKDGSRILLAKFSGHPERESCLCWCVAGEWSLKWNNWNDGVEPAGLAEPTHWMRVPKPWPMPEAK